MTRTLLNLVELLGVVVAVVLTFVLASLSATLTDNVLGWLDVGDISWLSPVFRLLPSPSRSPRAGCCFSTSTRSCRRPASRGGLSGAAR